MLLCGSGVRDDDVAESAITKSQIVLLQITYQLISNVSFECNGLLVIFSLDAIDVFNQQPSDNLFFVLLHLTILLPILFRTRTVFTEQTDCLEFGFWYHTSELSQ